MLKKYKIEPKSCIYVMATYLCSWGMAYLLEEFVRLSAIFKLEIFAQRIDINEPIYLDEYIPYPKSASRDIQKTSVINYRTQRNTISQRKRTCVI